MVQILDKIELKPGKQKHNQLFYRSPFSQKEALDFIVDIPRNTWTDVSLDRQGDVITFVCLYLQSMQLSHAISDALRWLENMLGSSALIALVPVDDFENENQNYIIRSIWPLTYEVLNRYIESRGIPRNIASEYLKQITVYNTKERTSFPAIGFRNEEGGYELRNQYFKGATGPKGITFIRGKTESPYKPDGFHVFHSVFDYLSILTQRKGAKFKEDVIILNCLSCLKGLTGYIKHYEYKRAYLWMNNDIAGYAANRSFVKFFKTERDLSCVLMNSQYAKFKDVNAKHTNDLGRFVYETN